MFEFLEPVVIGPGFGNREECIAEGWEFGREDAEIYVTAEVVLSEVIIQAVHTEVVVQWEVLPNSPIESRYPNRIGLIIPDEEVESRAAEVSSPFPMS
jgi:hypothetical protein